MTSHATWVDLKGKDVVPETVDHVIVPVRSSSSFAPWGNTFLFDQETDGVHANEKLLFRRENATSEEKSQIIKRMKLEAVKKIVDTFQMSTCLIFCRTNKDCDHLEQFFIKLSVGSGGGGGGGGGGGRGGGKHSGKKESGKEHVYSCVVVAGKRQQRERRENLDAFRDGDGTFVK